MNKTQFIEYVAQDMGTSKEETKKYLDKILDGITKIVAEGDELKLPTFGSFMKRERKARTARNPQTGDTMQVEARTVAVFRPGTVFKARVNGDQTPTN